MEMATKNISQRISDESVLRFVLMLNCVHVHMNTVEALLTSYELGHNYSGHLHAGDFLVKFGQEVSSP